MGQSALKGKKVLLGVCAGIAAYKSIEICRRLVDLGAEVIPILTRDALEFIGPMSLSALASRPVITTIFDPQDPLAHTNLARELDLALVVPATADFIARFRAGMANDALTATLLATTAPVVVAPAMHSQMWEHPATMENIRVLRERNVTVVGPARGRLAGGDSGIGRLSEGSEIIAACDRAVQDRAVQDRAVQDRALPDRADQERNLSTVHQSDVIDMAGLRVLITSGGTREPIDPVRYIGNRSSGKQGFAIAQAARVGGAEVVLISTSSAFGEFGTSGEDDLHSTSNGPGKSVISKVGDLNSLAVIEVETAGEMADEVLERVTWFDIAILSAAVADFRPTEVLPHKHKKADGPPTIVLEPTQDILKELGERRREGQVIVGFCAETENLKEQALIKLRSKRADIIVANDVSQPGVGFGFDTNEVLIVTSSSVEPIPLTSKNEVAVEVLKAALGLYRKYNNKELDK